MTTATKERKTKAVSIDAEALKDAVACVMKAVSPRSPKPILQNVLLSNGWIIATDLELRIDRKVDYHGEDVLLPGKKLQDILANSTGPTVEIKPEGQVCVVKIGKGEWRLPTEDAAEFPAWEPQDTKLVCRLPSDQCRRAIKSVVYATDNESSRYALGGVRIEVSRDEGKVWFVATDGRRLSLATMSLGNNQDPDSRASIVPDRVMSIICESTEKDGQVEFLSNDREFVANLGDAIVTARQLEGSFPRWRDVCKPVHGSTKHMVSLDALLRATKAARIVTSEQSKGVTYTFANSILTLTAKSSESGSSEVECEVEEYGRDASVKLDPKFVAQVCESLKKLEGAPDIAVSLNRPGDAVCIKYGDDGEYQSVIMPLSE